MSGPPSDGQAGDWLALLEEARQLVLEVADSDLVELEIALAGTEIRIRQAPSPRSFGAAVPPPELAEAHLVPIRSPLNGVFYGRPDPSAPPYVQVGDLIEVDEVVCLVEAMKSFNEIRSEIAGRLARVVVENAQVVHAGDTLMLVEPTGESDVKAPAAPPSV